MKNITIIDNDGIVKGHDNGSRDQIILFKINDIKYKISIHSETYSNQSYAILYQWTSEKGFSPIVKKNPKRDFNVDISYKDSYPKNAFLPIINRLQNIAMDL